MMTTHQLRINTQRLLDDMDALARIGSTPDGGVSRPALSPADVEARNWYRQQVESAGLQFRQDGAGNLSAVLAADNPDAPTLLFGSHLDSVPNGGRFDGALGALTALEALRTIHEAGLRFPVHLEAISFTDEEGALLSLMGSRAAAGLPINFDEVRDQEAFNARMERIGITRESILRAKRGGIKAFVELHIEQGTRLEEAGLQIGAVTSIVGIRSFWLTFRGEAAHAGTMPMDKRRDALWGALDFVGRARTLVIQKFSPGVMNCGGLQISPGAFNIVPAAVRLALEFRHGTTQQLDIMENELLSLVQESATQFQLDLNIESGSRVEPALMDETVVTAVESAADLLALKHTRLMSFAGHDTQSMSQIVPAAMFFVPSVKGISHNPAEFTRPDDVVNGANVLLHTVLKLAQS